MAYLLDIGRTNQHQHERGQEDKEGRQDRPRQPAGQIPREGGEQHEWPGRGNTQRHAIEELPGRQPVVAVDRVTLQEGH